MCLDCISKSKTKTYNLCSGKILKRSQWINDIMASQIKESCYLEKQNKTTTSQ